MINPRGNCFTCQFLEMTNTDLAIFRLGNLTHTADMICNSDYSARHNHHLPCEDADYEYLNEACSSYKEQL